MKIITISESKCITNKLWNRFSWEEQSTICNQYCFLVKLNSNTLNSTIKLLIKEALLLIVWASLWTDNTTHLTVGFLELTSHASFGNGISRNTKDVMLASTGDSFVVSPFTSSHYYTFKRCTLHLTPVI